MQGLTEKSLDLVFAIHAYSCLLITPQMQVFRHSHCWIWGIHSSGLWYHMGNVQWRLLLWNFDSWRWDCWTHV